MKDQLISMLMVGGVLICMGAVAIGAAIENKGAENILICGGKLSDVHFPHHRHQNVLGDCSVCHNLFPQKPGSLKELKSQGKLKKKQVMREHCIDCHKKMKADGKKTGPISCAKCHRKSE